MKTQNEMISDTYDYNRRMNDRLVDVLNSNFQWLIDYVKSKEELDFLTRKDDFSVYRGTSSILNIHYTATMAKPQFKVAASYKKHFPEGDIENILKVKGFEEYLENVNNDEYFMTYYRNHSTKNEGYFQNRIGRRYTFQNNENDDFIIFDKELNLGFASREKEKQYNETIEQGLFVKYQEFLRLTTEEDLPKQESFTHGEIDLMALAWNGDLIIMELKQNDGKKTAFSPIQLAFYEEQFKPILKKHKKELYERIVKMIEQKIGLGVLTIPKGRVIPKELSGNIRKYLIIGDESGLTKTMKERFNLLQEIYLPQVRAFIWEEKTKSIKEHIL